VSEIVITDEDRDLWEIYLEKKAFTAALVYAKVFSPRVSTYNRTTISEI